MFCPHCQYSTLSQLRQSLPFFYDPHPRGKVLAFLCGSEALGSLPRPTQVNIHIPTGFHTRKLPPFHTHGPLEKQALGGQWKRSHTAGENAAAGDSFSESSHISPSGAAYWCSVLSHRVSHWLWTCCIAEQDCKHLIILSQPLSIGTTGKHHHPWLHVFEISLCNKAQRPTGIS